ncbi:MAG: type I-D CRISPR-associated helicase Cas3' [Blastochloris sp.]|nr:type I-D CRISPR-associated helicase Cas3' [Blastochloris sp.]
MSSHLDTILLPWFRTHHPHTRAALIVNSVVSAMRLEQLLAPRLQAEGLTVAANTGLNPRAARRASYTADVLIGTSTVDVGVDFRINLLMFEAPSAATFLQRLGRLGRHKDFEHQGQCYTFREFAAYALVPPFVYERLFVGHNGEPPALAQGATLTREELTAHINKVYPAPARFDHYARRWGRFQPAKVYDTLKNARIRDSYADLRERLKKRYYHLTSSYMSTALRDWKAHHLAGTELLVAEAQSFRGGSPFDCGLIKQDEAATSEPLTYNLFWLLANAHLELLDQEAFRAALHQMGASDRPFQATFQAASFRWRGFRAQPEKVTVLLDPAVSAWDNTRHYSAQVLPGIALECLGHEFMNPLNRTLATRRVVGLLVPGYHPQQLRREVYLPGHFPLHRYCDDNNRDGTIAFGRQALLLDSVLMYRKHKLHNGAPIFC